MWKKRATELAVTGKLSNTVFKKSSVFNGETGAFCGQGIVTKDNVVTVGVKVAAAADMQHQLAATDRVVVDFLRLCEAVRNQTQFLTLTAVALVKIYMKHFRIKHIRRL
jgi:hypothetical protein